jgi:uncharacterized protein Yka (UPF0111/DUF47 family)
MATQGATMHGRAPKDEARTKKSLIVGVLGETGLLVPELVHQALAANARAKYFFTLLQLARAHADAIDASVPDLRSDRELAGIDDNRFDAVVAGSRRDHGDAYHIPLATVIVERVLADLDAMTAPLRAASPARFDERTLTELERRRSMLSAACLPRGEASIAANALTLLTSSDRVRTDSAHLLVFDLHKAVDAVAASLATEDIDGAKSFGLDAADRPLVAAFMRGVHLTEAVKLEHPGLGTMATRSGKVLLLENDIGETAAHVFLVRVEGQRVIVRSTDVHLPRIEFLQQMLGGFHVEWSDVRSRSAHELEGAGLFYECVGTFDASDGAELERFLTHLGSRLVFLIDWNRARKTLRVFVPKAESLALLAWAAEEGCGHRGLLEMGGERLVFDAMAAVVRTSLRFGERLDDVLGGRAATEFLRFVLRTCSVGLRGKRSRSLLRAEIRAELASAVSAGGDRLLAPLADHASLVREVALSLRHQLRESDGDASAPAKQSLARTAKDREHRGDEIVILLRNLARRIPEAEPYRHVIELADDAADALEEATFQLSLLPTVVPTPLRSLDLAEIGDLVVATTEAYQACVASAQRRGREELHRVLDAFDEIVALEHRMDDAERRFVAALAKDGAVSGKLFVIGSRIASAVEDAVDALTRAALLVRDHVTSAS